MNPHSRAAKENTSIRNQSLQQDATRLLQRPCYQRGSLCQDSAGSRTTQRPPDYRKETQTAMVWTCLPFIRSSQNHLARHSEREKKTRQTKEEVGRQHQRMAGPGVRQVPEGSGEQTKTEATSCEVICGAPTILAVKGYVRRGEENHDHSACRIYFNSRTARDRFIVINSFRFFPVVCVV